MVQPCSSLVVVTVRPASSVWEETARAKLRPPLDEEDALDDELTEARPELLAEALALALRPRRAETETAAPGGATERISRPSARIRVTTQLSLEAATFPFRAGAADAAVAATAMSVRGRRTVI
jgi:hypothetical protein